MLRNNHISIFGKVSGIARAAAMLIVGMLLGFSCAHAQTDTSIKAERNYIKDGNKAYKEGNYKKAFDYYTKALDVAPASEAAKFNLAIASMMLSDGGNDSLMESKALKIYESLGQSASNASIKEKANYNLGNHAFNKGALLDSDPAGKQQSAQYYKQSIEYYKKVLRSNPSNLKARENLRVAQLKLPPEDQNQDNQQNQQNQPDPKEDKQDQKDQQQPQQQPQQPQNGNADQILQSMQNRENQTRKEAQKKEKPIGSATTDKPW